MQRAPLRAALLRRAWCGAAPHQASQHPPLSWPALLRAGAGSGSGAAARAAGAWRAFAAEAEAAAAAGRMKPGGRDIDYQSPARRK